MNYPEIEVMGIGSPVVDYVGDVDEASLLSISGAKGGMELVEAKEIMKLRSLPSQEPIMAPGGSAGNTTFALARMGMSCSFMGKLGDDDHGTFYRSMFEDAGGDCSRFKLTNKDDTACCISLVTPDSERTMRTCLGAALTFQPKDISPKDFEGCRHAHVEGYLLFNPELITAVLEAADQAGTRISLDLGSFEVVNAARDILPDLLSRHVDIVFANEEEAGAMFGHDDPEAALDALGEMCPVSVVKVGKEGAWLKQGDERCHVPAIPVDDLRDTTGAGDYFAAGFLYAHLNDYHLNICGKTGALFAGYVIQNMGAVLAEDQWGRLLIDSVNLFRHSGSMENKQSMSA